MNQFKICSLGQDNLRKWNQMWRKQPKRLMGNMRSPIQRQTSLKIRMKCAIGRISQMSDIWSMSGDILLMSDQIEWLTEQKENIDEAIWKTISTWPPQWLLSEWVSEWVTKGSSRDASASKNMISLRTFPLSAKCLTKRIRASVQYHLPSYPLVCHSH